MPALINARCLCCTFTQNQAGWLKYQDTSTGELVYEHSTKLGNCDCMVQNPWNAIINLGHYNGKIPCLVRVASTVANARGISIGQARLPCGVQT